MRQLPGNPCRGELLPPPFLRMSTDGILQRILLGGILYSLGNRFSMFAQEEPDGKPVPALQPPAISMRQAHQHEVFEQGGLAAARRAEQHEMLSLECWSCKNLLHGMASWCKGGGQSKRVGGDL